MAAKVGTVRILYGAGTISLQAVLYPEHMLGALNMKEEEVSHAEQCFPFWRKVMYI